MLRVRLLAALALLLFSLPLPSVQAQGLVELGAQGNALFEAGDYSGASKIFEQFLQKYPESIHADATRYFLGLCYLSLQQPEKALPLLVKAAGSTQESAKPKRAYALFYIALCQLAKANSPSDTPQVAAADFTETTKTIDMLLKEFPDIDLQPDALITRARANVGLKNYDKASQDLTALRTLDPEGPLALDSDYLLGYVIYQQAQQLLADFKKDEASEKIAAAREIYQRLADNDNLAVANDASLQLANLLLADKNYDGARAAYRDLRTKKDVIAELQSRLDKNRALLKQSAGSNPAAEKKFTRLIQHDQQKIDEVQQNPDMSILALNRIGDTYLQQGKYDEARTVYRQAAAYADPEQKKQIEGQIIISLAMQGQADRAKTAYEAFQKAHPNDPLSETMDFLLGNALFQQQRYDEALQALQQSRERYPNGRMIGEVIRLNAMIYMAKKLPSDAIKTFDDFISQAEKGTIKVSPESLDDVKLRRASTLVEMQKTDEAVVAMRNIAETSKTPAIKEAAAYQIPLILITQKKIPDAIQAFVAFAKAYPASPNAPKSLYQVVQLNEKASDENGTIAAAQAFLQAYPEDPLALTVYEKIWKAQIKNKDYDAAFKTQADATAKFPGNPRLIVATFDKAKAQLEGLKKSEDAAPNFQKVIADYDKLDKSGLDETTAKYLRWHAARSTLFLSDMAKKDASAIGTPQSLQDAALASYQAKMKASLDFLASGLVKYGDTDLGNTFLKNYTELLLQQVRAGQMTSDAANQSFTTLIGSLKDPGLRGQVLMARAGVFYELGRKQEALLYFKDAFEKNPDAKFGWEDLSRYANALLEAGQPQQALPLFIQIGKNNASQAQAESLYGQGKALQDQGNLAESAKFFQELKDKYPTSPRILEADYGNALGLASSGKYDEAFTLLKAIQANKTAGNDLRARCLIRIGILYTEVGDKKTSVKETKLPENMKDGKEMSPYELAQNYFVKTSLLFPSFPEIVAEALVRAGEVARKQGKDADARKYFQQVLDKYSSSPWASKAREQMK
jgi:tetratricopeptide (TPR) repeat protein